MNDLKNWNKKHLHFNSVAFLPPKIKILKKKNLN
jgi:hypothetical protein